MFIALIVTLVMLSAAITLGAERYGRYRQVLDFPSARSSHTTPIPRGGGVAIVLITTAAACVLSSLKLLPANTVLAVVGGGLPLALVSFWDDHHSLPPIARLGAHMLVAVWTVAWFGGMSAVDFGAVVFQSPIAGGLMAVVGLVWLINLTNFMDGIDGLAGSEFCFVCAFGGLLLLARNPGLAWLSWSVAAACAGFLSRNWSPARVFLGDVGSGFLGFIFGVLMLASAGTLKQGQCRQGTGADRG